MAPASAERAAFAGEKSSFADILRQPDFVRLFDESGQAASLSRNGDVWQDRDRSVRRRVDAEGCTFQLSAPTSLATHVQLRWRSKLPPDLLVNGDQWERSYGDLAWRHMRPERPMPWYFLTFDGACVHGYGVSTGAGSLVFWQCDREGISLWMDVRNGGNGVALGSRHLNMATVVSRQGEIGEDPFAAARAFCALIAKDVTLASTRGGNSLLAVYGSNDWYYAYGKNSAAGILRDADLMAELAPSGDLRPYTIIDDGWDDPGRFPDMPALAAEIRSRSVVPGIWIRPLKAESSADPRLLLPPARYGLRVERTGDLAFDPTMEDGRHAILQKVRQVKLWNYVLIKHDFSTYDLFGQWGNEMHATPTVAGWSFHDRSLTNAEIVLSLYRSIRAEAGEQTVLLGCNVIGHLSAGIFDLQRTGDDVSGRVWERTRRMGVNTLAFRLPQHRTFFIADPDCVPITSKIPWTLTEQWLRAVAASGTALLISPEAGATGPEQKRAIRAAFASVQNGQSYAIPTDWLETSAPSRWKSDAAGSEAVYEWMEECGASPFPI